MTILDEGQALRAEVAKLRPDKRRRYPDELRASILNWVARATASGTPESDCAKTLGMKTWRFKLWRRGQAVGTRQSDESLALVQLDVQSTSGHASAITLVAPSGYRIEGLRLDQVIALLRELA